MDSLLPILFNEEIICQIIKQYTFCVSLLNELFSYAPDKCYLADDATKGIGCCNIALAFTQRSIIGPAKARLIHLQETRANQLEYIPDSDCPYHCRNHGCVLTVEKSPLCLAQYCSGDLERIYDQAFVRVKLNKILAGNPQNGKYFPAENQILVMELEDYVNHLLRRLGD